jgi:hypothetical protein
MRSSNHFWCIETVGKGVYKLTVYGKDPVSKDPDRGAAEILLDDDDIDELVLSAHKAQRAKVTISAEG